MNSAVHPVLHPDEIPSPVFEDLPSLHGERDICEVGINHEHDSDIEVVEALTNDGEIFN